VSFAVSVITLIQNSHTIAASIVYSKIDYCNSLYYNLPKSQINRFHQIQNCLARTVVKAPKSSQITPILRSLQWLNIIERIEYINSSHSPTKFLQPAKLTTYTILSLFSLQVEVAPHLLSPYSSRPPVSSQLPTALSHMHHLTCGISFLLHSVNLILFTLLALVHLILRISHHHSHNLRSHYLSLPLHFTPDLKLISFTNPFLHSHSYSFRTDFTDLNLY